MPFVVEFFTIDECTKDVDLLITPKEDTTWSFSFDEPDPPVNRDNSERSFVKGYNRVTYVVLLKLFLNSSRNLFCASLFFLM